RMVFRAVPGLTNAIVPYAVLSGSGGLDFATVTNTTSGALPGANYLGALTSGPNFSTTLAGATATTNVKLAAGATVGAAQSVNALMLPTGGLSVGGAGPLTIGTGLLVSRGAGNSVGVTTLNLGTTESVIYVDGVGSSLALSSNIGGSTNSLANGGLGTLVLSGNNTFTGATRLETGVVRVTSNTAFGAAV